MGPVSAPERVTSIDILRGAALFGILAANIRGFFAPMAVYMLPSEHFRAGIDQFAQGLVDYLIQGKFVTLFSILFGIGFAIQMGRAEERGTGIGFYRRRLGVLALFGLVHGLLIWWGDILLMYAATGFLLLLFRKRKQKTIAIWAVSLSCLIFLMMTGAWLAGQSPMPPVPKPDALAKAFDAYRDGPMLARLQQNFRDWSMGYIFAPIFVLVYGLPRFLAGLWLWRTGLFQRLPEFAPRLRKVQIAAGLIGITGTAVMLGMRFTTGVSMDKFTGPMLAYACINEITVPALSVLYGSTVLLLSMREEWRARLAAFGDVGRMALTNYLLQSIIGTSIFYYTGLYGRVGPAVGIPLTFAIYAAQVWFSRWWMERYRFGPAEWLWRTLTYGERLSMRIESARASAAARSV